MPRRALAAADEQRSLFDARDRTLTWLAETRAELIAAADRIALEVYRVERSVTSTRLIRAMRAAGWGPTMDGVDPRWIGAVLLPSKGWVRTNAIERTGSKGRPVTVWIRREG